MKKAAALIKKFFERKRKAAPAYSIRALARDTKLSPSFLSEVMAGKKRLAFNRIDLVSRVLDMDLDAAMELRRAYIPSEVLASISKAEKSTRSEEYFQVGKPSFGILRNWYYLAILDLTTCSNFGGRIEEIARRLRLHPNTAAVAVRELMKSGLLIEKDGKLTKAHDSIRFGSSIPRSDIASFHGQMLDKAKTELTQRMDEESWQKRIITGITCTADPTKIETAKKMLSDCLHDIADLLADEGDCTKVYHLAAQLFPLAE